MDSHLGRALWRLSVDTLTNLLTYGEGTRIANGQVPKKRKNSRRRSPRARLDLSGLRRKTSSRDEDDRKRSKTPSPRTRKKSTTATRTPSSSPSSPASVLREFKRPTTTASPRPTSPTTSEEYHGRFVRFNPLAVVIEG